MAKTKDGIEFYLAEVSPKSDATDMGGVRKGIEALCRSGDAVFEVEGNIYLAIVSDVPGVGTALRRLLTLVRQEELAAKVRLLTEPFPEQVGNAASKVILGEVPIAHRGIGRRAPAVDDAFDVEVRPDQG